MSLVKRVGILTLILGGLYFWSNLSAVAAQTPRPTPTVDPGAPLPTRTPTATPTQTPVPPTLTPTPTGQAGESQGLGTIRGAVYEDVNSDGKCIGTGIAGEQPAAGITIEFVSSDEQTVINLTSGPDGLYGLAAAGYSYWAVSARPGTDWVVTSNETLTVPIFEDSLVATNVNFCVQRAGTARVVLPASGAAGGTAVFSLLALVGLAMMTIGAGWQLRQRRKG